MIPPKDFVRPLEVVPIDQQLKRIAKSFKTNLEAIRELANHGDGNAKEYAAASIGFGSPKKHVIASALACCDEELAILFGRVRWRCSLSVQKVRTIVRALRKDSMDTKAPARKVKEYIHDFSASNYTIPELIGQHKGFPAEDNPTFKFWLVAESETDGQSMKARQKYIYRDMVKLCVVDSAIKMVIYHGYEEDDQESRQALVSGATDVIRRIAPAHVAGSGWLFAGLTGTWPASQSVYFHTVTSADYQRDEQNW